MRKRMRRKRMNRRRTKMEVWRAAQEEAAREHFEQMLAGLADPRRRQGVRYPLRTVVVVALMAMVCGADDAEGMQRWGEANEEWLSGFLEMPHGPPTQDVFLRVLGALDPEALRAVIQSWVELLRARLAGAPEHVAIDGKTCRGSRDRGSGKAALHMVNAWLVEANLVLGQLPTRKKSNELRAIPELVRVLDLSGALVTVDAMGTHRSVAEAIVEQGGDYLLAVKENQPTLYRDVAASFEDALDERPRALDRDPALVVERWSDTDGGHGRIEEREVYVIRDLSWLTTQERWSELSYIVMTVCRRTELSTGKESREVRYFIGSERARRMSIERIAAGIRGHWSIENQLHWVLDVGFSEDRLRHRAHHCAENMAALRQLALSLLKQEKTCRLGISNKRKLAGWDRSYLLRVLVGV